MTDLTTFFACVKYLRTYLPHSAERVATICFVVTRGCTTHLARKTLNFSLSPAEAILLGPNV
jgi:hypothetical protein